MKKRTVKEFDAIKGYGFISEEDNEDYFVHVSGLRACQRVSFDADFGMRGDKAINVNFD